MARPAAAFLALALALAATGLPAAAAGPAPAPQAGDPWQGLDPEGHAQTCKHFANRTRFRDRRATPAHLVAAADSCAEALALIAPGEARAALGDAAPDPARAAAPPPDARDPRAQQRRRAEAATLLTLLTRLRVTVRGMNMERVYGAAEPRPRALPVASARGGWQRMGSPGDPVSTTGEYLIAREMGVVDALRRWERVGR